MLTPPKRLFHVPSMSTVMYENVMDDVKEKGYVAISHVWGDQKMYSADELGIRNGINWKIPLSDPSKISRLKDAILICEKEYCWWDVLCMPQDKQDEINKEILSMGDYYRGATITLILSDTEYNFTERFIRWYKTILDIVDSKRDPTMEEEIYLSKDGIGLNNFAKDQWNKRVWTYQEAVLSNKIILIGSNGIPINLWEISGMVYWIINKDLNYASSFASSLQDFYSISLSIIDHRKNQLDLIEMLTRISERDCHRIHDRFYGVFGLLGYKDFVVDYDINIDELNKKVAQYAYSRGDISWIAIGGNFGNNFLQPMYNRHTGYRGLKTLNLCDNLTILKNNHLHMKMINFGTVSRYQKYDMKVPDFEEIRRIFSLCIKWGFSNSEIMYTTSGYFHVDEKYLRYMTLIFNTFVNGDNIGSILNTFLPENFKYTPFTYEEFSNIGKQARDIFNRMASNLSYMEVYIVEVIGLDKKYLLLVHGDVNTGDKIMVSMMVCKFKERLGIVLNSNKRKGICYIASELVPENSLYTSYEFLL